MVRDITFKLDVDSLRFHWQMEDSWCLTSHAASPGLERGSPLDMRIRVQQHTFAWFDVVLAVFTREFAMIQTLAGKPVEKNTWFKNIVTTIGKS